MSEQPATPVPRGMAHQSASQPLPQQARQPTPGETWAPRSGSAMTQAHYWYCYVLQLAQSLKGMNMTRRL